MDLILPAAGSASRMNGIPKFLLPIAIDGTSLIERHLKNIPPEIENIWIPTTSVFEPLIRGLNQKGIQVVVFSTKSMTETIIEVTQRSSASKFAIIMPDTYFMGENPLEYLIESSDDLNIACWKIKAEQRGKLGQIEIKDGQILQIIDKDPDCEFEYSWGALSFNRKFIDLLEPEMPHVGFAIPKALSHDLTHSTKIMDGEYFDCGTPTEYLDLIYKLCRKEFD